MIARLNYQDFMNSERLIGKSAVCETNVDDRVGIISPLGCRVATRGVDRPNNAKQCTNKTRCIIKRREQLVV